MKEIIFSVLIILFIGFLIVASSNKSNLSTANAAGTVAARYVWTDSTTLNTTGFDSTFDKRWHQTLIKIVGGDAYAKFGAPDTAGWSDRDWYFIGSGETVSFGPSTKLKRMEIKAASSTVKFFQIGYKAVTQH